MNIYHFDCLSCRPPRKHAYQTAEQAVAHEDIHIQTYGCNLTEVWEEVDYENGYTPTDRIDEARNEDD